MEIRCRIPIMSSQEQTGDEQAEDQEATGQAPDAAPDEQRIADVGERIDKARNQAEDAGVLVDEDEEHFADSGATESEDDQTIVPPG
jgi:hypothetical protein